jgi:hypothetical protein
MTIYRNDAQRYRPSVQRRDRRWEIHAGNRRFAIVFSDHRASAPVASFQVLRRVGESRRPSGGAVTKAIGAILAMIGGAATIGIALQADGARAGSGSYVVSVPVPQRAAIKVAAAPAKPAWRPASHSVTSASAAASTNGVAPSRAVDTTEATSVDMPAGLTTRQGALVAALRTGVLQQWVRAGGDERGFVVAGPAQDGCRDLSVLTRRFGDDDRVEKVRQCGAPSAAD